MTTWAYPVLSGVHLLVLSLLVGFMAVVEWSLVPAQNRLDGPGYARLEQGMNRVLETLTPVLMIVALAAGVGAALTGFAGGREPAWLLVPAGVAQVSMIVTTLIINAPVNKAIDTWDDARPPADWAALRDRWERGHTIRVYPGLLALAATVTAAVWP